MNAVRIHQVFVEDMYRICGQKDIHLERSYFNAPYARTDPRSKILLLPLSPPAEAERSSRSSPKHPFQYRYAIP